MLDRPSSGGDNAGVSDVDIDEDLAFQAAQWRFERIGWAVMALVTLVGLAGLFGKGPISTRTATDPTNALTVEYERYTRHRAPETLLVRVSDGVGDDGVVRVWIDRTYLAGTEVQSVFPEPDSVEADRERVIYVFTLAQGGTVTFNLMHEGIGTTEGRAGIDGGPSVRFHQFVYA